MFINPQRNPEPMKQSFHILSCPSLWQPLTCAVPVDPDKFSSVQSLSHVQLFEIPWTAARQASLSITNSRGLLKLISIDSVIPLTQWFHPTILSSVVSFSSCLQSFQVSGSFPISQFFASGGQSIGASASASVLAKNTQDWSPLEWTGWISL